MAKKHLHREEVENLLRIQPAMPDDIRESKGMGTTAIRGSYIPTAISETRYRRQDGYTH
jgi:hypothetical protein